MNKKLASLIEQSHKYKNLYSPLIFRLQNQEDKVKFQKLLDEDSALLVYDELQGQLEELVKSRNPKVVFKKDELAKAAIEYLGGISMEEYGAWVYYPWSKRLVHILDENEYVEVRTNRNQYKITPDEREALSKKKIGIIGLSVGQSIALTMAMERIFGELRLADFDKLELSNLNRIRTGAYNLEVLKVYMAAREIAEIDPYLKVVCYPEGITENNLNNFFTEGGKLDICVEVCDGLNEKIITRHKARELGVTVVMNSSDRGTTDIERYDLDPQRSIIHGLIDHLDLNQVKDAKTNEEKVPFLLPMLGLNTCSTRLKASMVEINQTITTWPQLASGVALGGAIITDINRRILLDQIHSSGRYLVDLEALISDEVQGGEVSKPAIKTPVRQSDPLSFEEMLEELQRMTLLNYEDQIEVKKEVVNELVRGAVLAPSAGNTQLWKWLYYKKNIYLFYNCLLTELSLDSNNYNNHVGFGAASENLVLKSHELNLEVAIESFPLGVNSRLIAIFRFFDKSSFKNTEPHHFDQLSDFIDKRLTNRKLGIDQGISPKMLDGLKEVAGSIKGAQLHLRTSHEEIVRIAEIAAKTDRIRLMNELDHKEFVQEIRWSKEENLKSQDGIDIEMVYLTPLEDAGFRVAKEWPVVQYVKDWKGGRSFEKLSKRVIPASSAVGLITMSDCNAKEFYSAGRAVQRVWLYANKNNISVHPHTSPLVFFSRLSCNNSNRLSNDDIDELTILKKEFEDIFQITSNVGNVFLFRLFYADAPTVRSVRRPIEEVFLYKGEE